jgi:MoxR-like ATPase
VRGTHHTIAPPFFVLATQNPIELEGTYPLPEAQLDRFLFNVVLDYLSADQELDVINRFTTRMDIPRVEPCTTPAEILKYQGIVRQVPIAESVNRYAVDLIRATRPDDPNAPDVIRKYVQYGASVRATMFVTLAAKAKALLSGRYHVTRDDIRSLALPVLRHRVLTNYFAESDSMTVDAILTQMVEAFDKGGVRAKAS